MTISQLDTALAEFQVVGADLRAAGLISSHGGNLSVWTPDGTLITREGAMLGGLGVADLCLIDRTTLPPAADPSLSRWPELSCAFRSPVLSGTQA